jgi:hypothetical protein
MPFSSSFIRAMFGRDKQQALVCPMGTLPWPLRLILAYLLLCGVSSEGGAAPAEREIPLVEVGAKPATFKGKVTGAGEFTWWLPSCGDALVLPVADGIVVDTSNAESMQWLRKGSPWGLAQLPTFGVRYGSRMLVVIVPWPHYAELVLHERVGVRFSWPKERGNAAPVDVVALWRGADPLQVAQAFRDWRETAESTGSIPRPRRLADKAAQLPRVSWLYSDLYAHSPRPDVAARATQLGFLFGPYDSYHSVHAPDAAPDDTWETSQFDKAAYEQGRVLNPDGTGRQGF